MCTHLTVCSNHTFFSLNPLYNLSRYKFVMGTPTILEPGSKQLSQPTAGIYLDGKEYKHFPNPMSISPLQDF